MSIAIECPSCGVTGQVPDQLSGKKVRCQTCREEFHIGVRHAVNEDEDDGQRPPPRRRSSSRLVVVAIIGGVLGMLLIKGMIVAFLVFGAAAQQPVAVGRPANNVVHIPARPPRIIPPNAILPRYTVIPLQPNGPGGRPANVPAGSDVVTLSNLRRAESVLAGWAAYQVDYQFQDADADNTDRYYLLVKMSTGIGQAALHDFGREAQGTESFAFFPGKDPNQGFELWIEREPLGKSSQRKRISQPVKLD